jgi:CubicO group peptidase (beta-lactamase class C family)
VLVDVAAQMNPGSPGEYGWAGSGSTFFWVDPVERLISILFAQFMPSSHHNIAREFKALMYQALI